jgi:hypothetical protein
MCEGQACIPFVCGHRKTPRVHESNLPTYSLNWICSSAVRSYINDGGGRPRPCAATIMAFRSDDNKQPKPQPGRRDRNQDEPPREDPDPNPEPTQPVGDPEPAVAPIKTVSGEPTRPLRPPAADASVERAVCKMCGKTFDSTGGLVDHEVTSHPNVSVPPKPTKQKDRTA